MENRTGPVSRDGSDISPAEILDLHQQLLNLRAAPELSVLQSEILQTSGAVAVAWRRRCCGTCLRSIEYCCGELSIVMRVRFMRKVADRIDEIDLKCRFFKRSLTLEFGFRE